MEPERLNEAISALLKDKSQDLFLNHLSQLNITQKDTLLKQLTKVDLKKVVDVLKNSITLENSYETFIDKLDPITFDQIDYDLTKMNSESLKDYEALGLNAISNGEVGLLLLAGGISTRLSISYPKGMFSIDLLSSKSLFQLQAEKIIRIKRLSAEANMNNRNKFSIPWYIMTSSFTHQATCEHFEANNYFGLDKEDVIFFEQSTLPLLSNDGKLILDENLILAQAPGGTDGLYDGLIKNRILDQMKGRGIKYIHIYCVENVLIKIADPVFTGICIRNNIDSGVKVKLYLIFFIIFELFYF
jgi:UDP-N-acetylglucosamine/UDP-N-acetylgalactosamine diphosphorylase